MSTQQETTGTSKGFERFDPTFTTNVIKSIGPKTDARSRQLMGSLIQHIHDFARENELTIDEWLTGVNFVNTIGQISTPPEMKVTEFPMFSDSNLWRDPTSSSILGPFWSPNAPFRPLGGSIIQDPVPAGGQTTLMHGTVTDLVTKKPIPNAVVDIWQASANGKYDFQDPENQTDNNLRGKFRTDENGQYHFYCLHPTAYSLPTDGPAGVLLKLLDRHPMRPAHIHLMISNENYKPVTTQIYPNTDPYLITDTVFAVKPDLVVDFKPRKDDPKAELDLEYNIILAPKDLKM
ncbi:Catechol 1,2-dioxygenase 3 [Botrytis cinerea]